MKMLFFLAAFLVAIGILVAVHEFGHYWVAKKLGFKVLRFSIGFGKPVLMRVGKDADRTEYCVAAIPLGGYVKLLDEREGEVDAAELHRSFTRRPVLHRIAVLLAGPAMNLLFAALLYSILAMVGTEIVKPVVGQVRLDSPAAVAGLQRGDEIVRVGDRNVEDTEELQIALIRQFSDDGVIPLRVRRDGGERSLTLRVAEDRRAMTEPGMLLPGLGFDLATWNANTLIHDVPADSAGARAGLRAGDRVLAVDGQPVVNSTEFVAMVNAAPGRDISIEVERAGARLRIVAPVPRVMEQGRAIGRLGIASGRRTEILSAGPGADAARRPARRAGGRGGEDLGDVIAHRADAVAYRDRTGFRQEHQRADQHRRVRRYQRVLGAVRVFGISGDHQRELGRAQFDARAAAGRRTGALSAGGSGEGNAAVRTRPAVRAAGRDRAARRIDEPGFL